MDINLIIYDMNIFLDKYTRFMTKDMYISSKLYSNFLEQYNYLFEVLINDKTVDKDNKQYKKIIDIIEKRKDLLKLHNKKYLTSALKKYKGLSNLSEREKEIVLTEEENTYIVSAKNKYSLIVSKLDYLLRYKNYKENNILILTTNDEKDIKRQCNINDIDVDIYTIKEYGIKVLDNKVLLNNNDRYNFLINYIMNDLFNDKLKFNSFYKAFSKYIYLNKDYRDYDTFKDYHNYMYKRKYLASNLSLKKFNEKEISKRKTYLRTINNENLKEKAEVDIANFLYLNSIDYLYDYDNSIFKLLDKDINVKFVKGVNKNTYKDKTIYLYSSYDDGKTYLEVLAYNLIKYMYPMEKLDDNMVYTKLCSTNIDNYFSEFINNYLIPLMNYYKEYNNLDNTDLSDNSKKEFLNIYQVYTKYIEDNNLIEELDLFKIIEEKITNSKYKYLFLIGNIPIKVSIPTLTIVDEYEGIDLIKDNIKLLYDYKKYLYENQSIPVINTFLGKEELSILTKKFLKDNLKIINKYLEDNIKKVTVYEYNDSNRLHVYNNISECCLELLKEYDNSVIALRDLKDINIFNSNKYFSKLNKNTLIVENNTINVYEIKKIDKIYDNIILPYLIKDNYHNELFIDDYQYNIKIMLYVALSKCRHSLIILIPNSKVLELNELLGINN